MFLTPFQIKLVIILVCFFYQKNVKYPAYTLVAIFRAPFSCVECGLMLLS